VVRLALLLGLLLPSIHVALQVDYIQFLSMIFKQLEAYGCSVIIIYIALLKIVIILLRYGGILAGWWERNLIPILMLDNIAISLIPALVPLFGEGMLDLFLHLYCLYWGATVIIYPLLALISLSSIVVKDDRELITPLTLTFTSYIAFSLLGRVNSINLRFSYPFTDLQVLGAKTLFLPFGALQSPDALPKSPIQISPSVGSLFILVCAIYLYYNLSAYPRMEGGPFPRRELVKPSSGIERLPSILHLGSTLLSASLISLTLLTILSHLLLGFQYPEIIQFTVIMILLSLTIAFIGGRRYSQ
jgi:hypothetical protein